MATAQTVQLFTSISGRIGNAVFYMRGTRQCIRTYIVPANTITEARRTVRRTFAQAVKSWQQQMPEHLKYAYKGKARGTRMSGYNLYISEFMRNKTVMQDKHSTARTNNSGIGINKALIFNTHRKTDKEHSPIHTVSKPFLPQKRFKNWPDQLEHLPESSGTEYLRYSRKKRLYRIPGIKPFAIESQREYR
ncbi:MAG: hypothetical protein JW864_02495 [Spirochaetes bacterium]|nr:hypothetical protein [Spirochaetota bacterium]